MGKSPGFRSDIEGLRGIAVLLVVLYHARVPGFGGGFVGVDVFFVLSGYLITGLCVQEVERTGRLRVREFYARRARRLLPASALAIVATIVASAFVFSPAEQARFARTALAAATYASNLWFASGSDDYFAADAETDPLLHTWSLSVEEQFYLVWPALVLLALRGGGSRRRLLGAMVGLSLISLAGSLWLTESRQVWAFYGTPARAWEFGAGGILSLLFLPGLRSRAVLNRILGWSGLLLLAAASVGFSKDTAFPGIAALVPVAGTLALLAAGSAAPGLGVGRLLAAAPLQRAGQLSYSWYLWHWPVLVIAAAVVPTLSLSGRLLCLLLSLALAAGSYVLVETPIRFHPRLSLRPAFSLWLAVVLTAGAGGISFGWYRVALRASDAPALVKLETAQRDRDGLGPCTASWGDTRAEMCGFGDPASEVTVALFGDSHAAHWFPAFRSMAEEHGWRLVTLTKHACPAAQLRWVDSRFRHRRECVRWRNQALDLLIGLEPDLVVLGNAPAAFYEGSGRDDWREAYGNTMRILDAEGIATLVLWGTPYAPEDLPTCLTRAVWKGENPNRECSIQASQALDSTSYLAALEVTSDLEYGTVADLSPHFCGERICKPIVKGTVVLYDNHHLTATRSAALAPVLSRIVTRLIGDADRVGSVENTAADPSRDLETPPPRDIAPPRGDAEESQ